MPAPPLHFLDANAVIAILEREAPFTPVQELFIKGIDAGTCRAVSSEIVLLECLVKPVRDGDQDTLNAVLRFFSDAVVLPLVPITRAITLRAAELRARDRLALTDALHVACALQAGCTVFLSADRRLRVPDGMTRIAFDELTLS